MASQLLKHYIISNIVFSSTPRNLRPVGWPISIVTSEPAMLLIDTAHGLRVLTKVLKKLELHPLDLVYIF